MAHGSIHRNAHLRHGRREIKLPRQNVETVVEIIYQTAAQTFDGPANFVTPTFLAGPPVQQTQQPQQPESQNNQEPAETEQDVPEVTSAPIPSVISAPLSAEPSNTNLLTAGSRPTSTRVNAAATAGPSSTSQASAADGGMSAGGTAGLVIGILLLIGVACALALFFIKKKKQQQENARQPIDDDEKAGGFVEKGSIYGGNGATAVAPASASIRTTRTASTAPRLSLRPVTEFDPALEEEKRRSAGNVLEMTSASTAGGMLAPAPGKPAASAWERRGAEKHGHDDPFSDPVNPFGNDAAASNPTGPLPKSPSSASQTLVEASAVSAGAPVAEAATDAAVAANSARKPLPYPQDASNATQEKPQIQTKAVPAEVPQQIVEAPQSPSPAWVEDVPASPGPAPSGPPPMAAFGSTPPSGPENVHRVQLDFKPSLDDELEIRAGQLVRMLHEYDDGWALCIRMDRSQQGVTPRSCLSKLPVKPRQAPPPGQGPNRRPPPGPRGPSGPNVPGTPRPLTPNGGRNSPRPMSPAQGPNSPGPRQQMRPRANTGQGHPRSMSPGPNGSTSQPGPFQHEARGRSNSAGPANPRRQSPPGPSPMNPNPQSPGRKAVPGMAL